MPAEAHTHILLLLRWIHFIAGITWIGHLYFFNFVNVPFTKTMDGETKKKVVPQLAPRALFWFRWGAMFTFISGVLYIIWKIFIATDAGLTGTGGLFTSTWGKWISFGGLLGTIMWFNVWFIIWPAQKKIIRWVKDGQSPPEMAGIVKKAYLASRTNTYLSIPMLFGMGAASHFPSFSLWGVPIVLGIGFAIAWHLVKLSAKAGSNF
ncbi:MAG: urate hydroxylase PuuD [Chlamydiae bacterium]|nr:urate hydroxylase PuuD [Chlamydiota bacterium]MBI3277606.1 urate hydroxylase PuuD [Chlamydiota bacterium]